MSALRHPIRWYRSLTVRAPRMRGLAAGTVLGLFLVVTTGAVVRLTASGLGCEHWPRCGGNTPFPEKGGHAAIEFSNRVVAFLTILLTLATWLAARKTDRFPRWARLAALFVFLAATFQIPLGGLTVIFHLNPLLVMSHFLLAVLVLGVAVVVLVETRRLEVGAASRLVPRYVAWAGTAAAVLCVAITVSGSFVTASGPHSGGQDIRRLGYFYDAVHVHAYLTVALMGTLVFLVLSLWRERATAPRLLQGGIVLVVLLGAQMIVGDVQYHTRLPWWLVLVHVSLFAAVWIWAVGLATVLWRPPRTLARRRAAVAQPAAHGVD